MTTLSNILSSSLLARLGACALALGAWVQPSTAQAASGDLCIMGAKAYLGEGKYLENATVIVRKEKIYKVKADQAPTKDCEMLYAQGRILSAGLIAAETPLGVMEIELEASTNDASSHSANAVRSHYQVAKAIFADSSALTMAQRWGVTNAAVTPTGGLVSGQVAWIDLRPGTYEDIVVEDSVGMRASLGQHPGTSRAATIQALEAVLEDAILYKGQKRAHQRGDLRSLAASFRDLNALKDVVRRRQRLLVEAERASDILAALDLAKRYKLDLALVGAQEGWKVAAQIAKAKAWVVLRPTDNLPKSFSRLGARADNATLLHKAGVKLVIANLGSAHNAARLRQEAGNAVAHGLPYTVALDAITLGPAQLYEMDDDYGSLEVGKIANLVVWSADPLEFSSSVHEVVVRGQLQRGPSRQSLLRDRYMDLDRFAPAKPPKFLPSNPVRHR